LSAELTGKPIILMSTTSLATARRIAKKVGSK